jgi:hypothetical protein
MSLPGFTADVALTTPAAPSAPMTVIPFTQGDLVLATWQGEMVPQFTVCTPCIGLPAGPFCFRVLGRRICLPIPNFGRWKGCCNVRIFPPGLSGCGVRPC